MPSSRPRFSVANAAERAAWASGLRSAAWMSAPGQPNVEPRVYPAGIALEDLFAVVLVQGADLVDVALGVVIGVTCLRIDTLDGAEHLGSKQDVVDRDHLGEQLDPRKMIDARVEEDVVQQM